ncbi:MAG: hypothetical protein IJQ50_00695 [Clostridia bacterium]|nr:hypothetical protein [Clostridia bacterium]
MIKNKKLKIAIIVLAVIVEIALLIYFVPRWLGHLLGFDYLRQEEMTEVLTENWDLFNETAEDLKPLFNDASIRSARITPGLWILNTDKIKLKHFLLLDVRLDTYLEASYEEYEDVKKEDLPEEKFERLNNSNAYKILRDLDFEQIIYRKSDKDCIYFHNRSYWSVSVSLVYCESGESQNEYIRTWEHIKGNWYYCIYG